MRKRKRQLTAEILTGIPAGDPAAVAGLPPLALFPAVSLFAGLNAAHKTGYTSEAVAPMPQPARCSRG